MKTLGIIPARGGSKGIPQKNIKLLNGKPLIAYTIEAAQRSDKLDHFIVSTDDEEIASICKNLGAEVPFMRPPELAQDDTTDKPVLEHAIDWLKANEAKEFDIIVLLRPTTPFKTPEIIDEAISLLENSGADSVRTVTKVEGVHHPYWMLKIDEDGKAVPFIEEIDTGKYLQRQLLPTAYRINGVVDVMKTSNVLDDSPELYGDDMRILEIAGQNSIDIDTELDFQYSEFLINMA